MNPQARRDDEAFLRTYLKKGDTVIDVGANIGNMTLTAAKIVGNSGKVISLEAHPITYKYLCNNINLNKLNNVNAINLAVGDKNGLVSFSHCIHDDINSVICDGGITVRSSTLDSLLFNDSMKINLLKIDTEGFELMVLKGASNCLTKIECILFESEEELFIRYGYTTSDLLNFIKSYGFKVYKLNGNKLYDISAPYTSMINENLLGIKDISNFMMRIGKPLNT